MRLFVQRWWRYPALHALMQCCVRHKCVGCWLVKCFEPSLVKGDRRILLVAERMHFEGCSLVKMRSVSPDFFHCSQIPVHIVGIHTQAAPVLFAYQARISHDIHLLCNLCLEEKTENLDPLGECTRRRLLLE